MSSYVLLSSQVMFSCHVKSCSHVMSSLVIRILFLFISAWLVGGFPVVLPSSDFRHWFSLPRLHRLRNALFRFIGVWRGVSKEVEDGQRPPALQTGQPWNDPKAVLGVVRLQGIEGYGMAGPVETLGSPWPSRAIRPCSDSPSRFGATLWNMLICRQNS
jgi:hypothetical protein